MDARRFVVALLVIAGAALALRVGYVVTVTQDETVAYDGFYYQSEAETVGRGKGFVTPFGGDENADHPPLTVLTLAPVARVTDGSELAMRLTVALAGVGVVVLIGLLGREVAGPRVGLVAAGTAALYPNLWMNDGLLMAETFAALTVAGTLLATVLLVRTPSWRHGLGAGVGCGLAMLARGELALLIPFVVLPAVVLLRDSSRQARLRLAGVTVGAALLVVSPWVAYNLSRFEEPVFLSNGDGGVLLGANCDDVYYGDGIGYWSITCAVAVPMKGRDRSEVSDAQREKAFDYIGDHLGRLPIVVLARLGRTWSLYAPGQSADLGVGEGRPHGLSLIGAALFWLLVPFAFFGVRRLRGDPALVPLLGPFVLVFVVAAVFYGAVRFRVPAEVPLVVLAAVGVDRLLVRSGNRGEDQRRRYPEQPEPGPERPGAAGAESGK
ncbi:MAG: glycosyltransferase family 39 protein [Actinobacteria bacterium]|nr:glycosyltransferase family 39 protein [Actinomycetota bacterium]